MQEALALAGYAIAELRWFSFLLAAAAAEQRHFDNEH
jgi:hypothetical protein